MPDIFAQRQVFQLQAGRLGAQQHIVADILLEESVFETGPQHRHAQRGHLDLRLACACVGTKLPSAKGDGQLVRLADGTVQVQQAIK